MTVPAQADISIAASEQSDTQPTQERSQQQLCIMDDRIWGSLIPSNSDNPNVYRMDFVKPQTKYTLGRGSRKADCDYTLPKLLEMSRVHCTIEWNGDDSLSGSEVILTDLNTTCGTWVCDDRVGRRTSKLLRDYDVVAFGKYSGDLGGQTKENNSFILRIWHLDRNRRALSCRLREFYDISEELGRGSYAAVFKAFNKAERKWYAVKLLPGSTSKPLGGDGSKVEALRVKTENKRRHIEHEIEILKNLQHPHIVQFKEHFAEESGISVVLELVMGGDLWSYLSERPDPLFEHEAQQVTYQICDALAYMHSQRVVHRDLKPQNVLVESKFPLHVKVADFGMAKVLDSLSNLQTRCGTPLFAAPEILANKGDGYTKVVDSWSLGVMVFIMVTEEDPFCDASHREVDWDKLHTRGLSRKGQLFLNDLLEYDPRHRITANRACKHPWLSEERARTPDHGQCMSRQLIPPPKPSTISSATVTVGGGAPPETLFCGQKRKRGNRDVSGAFSVLSINEEQRNVAKRPRKERSDEIPGLGQWSDCGGS